MPSFSLPPCVLTHARECKGCLGTLCKGCHGAEHTTRKGWATRPSQSDSGEISRVLVLNLLWFDKTGGACAPPRISTPLTEYSLLSRGTRSCVVTAGQKPGPPVPKAACSSCGPKTSAVLHQLQISAKGSTGRAGDEQEKLHPVGIRILPRSDRVHA